jgi:hypothetical protein
MYGTHSTDESNTGATSETSRSQTTEGQNRAVRPLVGRDGEYDSGGDRG